MTTASTLDQGREAFVRQAWGEAYALLRSADREAPLEAGDLERLATATYLIGRDGDSDDVLERAHHAFLDRGDPPRAARCAFWLGLRLLFRREMARGSGWLARARRLVDDQLDCGAGLPARAGRAPAPERG